MPYASLWHGLHDKVIAGLQTALFDLGADNRFVLFGVSRVYSKLNVIVTINIGLTIADYPRRTGALENV